MVSVINTPQVELRSEREEAPGSRWLGGNGSSYGDATDQW